MMVEGRNICLGFDLFLQLKVKQCKRLVEMSKVLHHDRLNFVMECRLLLVVVLNVCRCKSVRHLINVSHCAMPLYWIVTLLAVANFSLSTRASPHIWCHELVLVKKLHSVVDNVAV